MSALRIFIADDHEMVRGVIMALLAFHPEWKICGEAADGAEAVEKVAQLNPDIVLVDVDMPNVDGLEATRRIVKENPSRKVIVLTMTSPDKLVRDIFHSGARGFVVKANATHDLASAIEAVARGRSFFSARFADMILSSYLQDDNAPESDDLGLRERERETIRLLTDELTMTLGHQWSKPKAARRMVTYFLYVVLICGGAAVIWYVLSDEPDHAPAAVSDFLVSTGLKSSPQSLDDGNPDAKVWIDIHTALYYCSSDDTFGKTSKGKIASQHDAQLDHFKPALGKTCN